LELTEALAQGNTVQGLIEVAPKFILAAINIVRIHKSDDNPITFAVTCQLHKTRDEAALQKLWVEAQRTGMKVVG
jgi:hypothetical protein